ncbi:MAG TPA: CDP-diacylglycerol--serine O-phosphatidyltransferase [Flavobacteriales bacterium]|nr:CDP-diacylglycerol--serine O-phosphatidyltransferase [Flavobacteriales bacterium]
MKKMIPNTITLMNLFSGCIGVVYAFTSDLRMVSIMIFISLLLDYLDGMAARMLDVKSDIGKELDSLADLVSFGLLPALIAFRLLKGGDYPNLAYVAFLITLLSAYRLAKFNLDTRQSVNFIGLPTPANAIFWSSFPLIIYGTADTMVAGYMSEIMSDSICILIAIPVFSYLLIAEIPLFSLKFQNFLWKGNEARLIFLAITLILFIPFSFYSLPFIILLYLLISIIKNQFFAQYEV